MLSMPEPMLSLSMPILATFPDRMGQTRMESGWAGIPDGLDGVYWMGPGCFPTAQYLVNPHVINKTMPSREALKTQACRPLPRSCSSVWSSYAAEDSLDSWTESGNVVSVRSVRSHVPYNVECQ